MKTRVRARIIGRVQGVGFRPTVYRYATQFGLGGFVRNDSHGVTLEVEGDDLQVGAFFNHLTHEPPRQAVIDGIRTEVLGTKGDSRFEVVESRHEGDVAAQIPPDLATCADCLREIFDPRNRRRGYAFTNCTNCGPRFTIVNDVPYDRARTSMAGFAMCEHCEHEYHNPRDRRLHAEPNACAVCGPHLELRVTGGTVTGDDPLAKTQELLRRGQIVALKSLGGYHLACDATSAETVARLRQRKHRPHKPFAVMFRDLETVKRYCEMNEAEEAELLSPARPIVVLKRVERASSLFMHSSRNGQDARSTLADGVSPDSPMIGAFLPYTPLHHLLMEGFDALVMTSGNLADEPIVSRDDELGVLTPIVDAVLTHNRPIVHKCDDSVVRVIGGRRQFLRRARGFVPNPIRMAKRSPQILAVGGELKNTFCLVRDGHAFLSQHIGDLKDYRTYDSFTREIAAWQKLMHVEPEVIAYDLHPAYLSTKFARAWRGTGVSEYWSAENGNHPKPNFPSLRRSITPLLVGVQHHHAHIASVMAEHNLHEPLIGVALDGTGYGTDGTIWGGEFFVADRSDFERVARFKPYPLPGGDKAVEEPWRMATSVLLAEGLANTVAALYERRRHFADSGSAVTDRRYNIGAVQRMIEANFNAPLTSSAGRLFDAVAAMLGLCDVASYEAQAAIRLESVADDRVTGRLPFDIATRGQPWKLDFGPSIRALQEMRQRDVPAGELAARFHNTVVAAVVEVCRFVRGQRNINVVALSGGVFQNVWLLERTTEALRARRFKVFTNVAVPPNDGGLALGQAAVAVERARRGQRED